jgi:serine/threonine-protein phosphatase 2B regulatory subunit
MASRSGHARSTAVVSAEPRKDAPPPVAAGPAGQFTDQEIKAAFDTFDLDRNRFVGAAELSHILNIIGEEVTDQEIDEMIQMCDGDGDGQVTFDEFYKLMTNPAPPLPTSLPAAPSRGSVSPRRAGASLSMARRSSGGYDMASHVASMMSADDTTSPKMQVGRVNSVKNIVRRLAGSNSKKLKPSQIKKVYRRFQDLDADGSGHLEYIEFINALELEDGQESRDLFEVFDTDGSGSISLKEFIVVLSRYTTASEMDKVKFAFMMFDEDGSGAIDRKELTHMVQASFLVEQLGDSDLQQRTDAVYAFLKKEPSEVISYEDCLMLANAKSGLIYPAEEGNAFQWMGAPNPGRGFHLP